MLSVQETIKNLKRRASRKRRWATFRFLRATSSLPGATRRCQLPAGADVRLALDSQGIAHVGGVTHCGSPWACPLCAPMVREHRANELDTALGNHLAQGGGAVFVTVTVPHRAGMALKPLLDTVVKGWTSVVATPTWAGKLLKDEHGETVRDPKWHPVYEEPGLKQTLGILGQIKAVEITYGANGWHPHCHVCVVTEKPLTEKQIEDLEKHVYRRWSRFAVKRGYGKPSKKHGVDVRPIRAREEDGGTSLGSYLCKIEGGWGVGLELSRADVKRGRKASETPWELLERAMAEATLPMPDLGGPSALELWHEYEQATRGTRALVWSPGLRTRLYLGAELPDPDAATQEPDQVVVEVLVRADQWIQVVANGLVPVVLDAFEHRGEAGVWEVLQRYRR